MQDFHNKLLHYLLFWLAFVLTRPFGATLGDVLTKAHDKGGLDFGTIGSSSILAVVLIALVFISIRNQRGEPALAVVPVTRRR